MRIDAHSHIFPELRGKIAAGNTRGLKNGIATIGEKCIQFLPPFVEKIIHTPEMLIAEMDRVGLDKVVLLQGSFFGNHNDYVRDAVRRYPDRLIGAAFIDPWEKGFHKAFEAIVGEGCFRAVKLECSEPTGFFGLHPEASLDQPEIKWLWERLEQERMVLVLDLGAVGSRSYQTNHVLTIAREYPSLKIVIAHLGQPSPKVESDPVLLRLWEEQIDLGLLPNVWFDTASLPAYVVDEGYPYPSAVRYIRKAIERIGPTKILWGSDVPTFFIHTTYAQMVKQAELCVEHLPAAERNLVLGDNAMQVFQAPVSESTATG